MQEFTAKLIEKENLTENVLFLSFQTPEFSYRAGQYMLFEITRGGETKLRAYSILNPAGQGKLNFIIRLLPNGFAGGYFREIQAGEEVTLKGPLGHMTFDEQANCHWFIGCGCGVAPLYCIVQKYLPLHPEKEFVLLFSSKKKKDLLFYDEFKSLEKKYPNFTYLASLTREDWDGKTGRVQNHLPQDLADKTFYICGVKELVEDTKELLLSKGVDPKRIKFERYS